MQKSIIALIIFLCAFLTAFSQNAIKLEKQKTLFLYTQLNLHTGVSNSGDGVQFGLPGRGAGNQLAFQVFSKSRDLLQKGYVPLISINSWKVKVAVGYGESSSTFTTLPGEVGPGPGPGPRPGPGNAPQEITTTNNLISLNLTEAWVKFNTKWDRTTLTAGYRAIPFGHNPNLDPNSSFMTNIASSDLGMNRDLGIFIKTPISPGLDLEAGLGSGGYFNAPLFQTGDIANQVEGNETTASSVLGSAYNGTWLMTGRLGQPSYLTSEVGGIFAVGSVNNHFGSDDKMFVVRVGGDWVYKIQDRFRITNQVIVGHTSTESEGNFVDFSLQNNVDVFLMRKVYLSLSNTLNLQKGVGDAPNYITSTLAGSATYAFTPHTRIRLNNYVSPIQYDGNSAWGVSAQLIVGLGKR